MSSLCCILPYFLILFEIPAKDNWILGFEGLVLLLGSFNKGEDLRG